MLVYEFCTHEMVEWIVTFSKTVNLFMHGETNIRHSVYAAHKIKGKISVYVCRMTSVGYMSRIL